jgi:hypothetical protein
MRRSLVAVFVLAVYLAAHLSGVTAQSGTVSWSLPANLSNSLQSSAYPAVVTDDFGFAHVFWSEDLGGRPLGPNDPSDSGNAILYTRWDGKGWTKPVDVLYSPDDPVASYPAAIVDKKGNIHLVWTGLTNIYYSQAPASQAESALAWSPPLVIASDSARSNWESSIAVDSEGNLHIAYAARGDEVGIYHVASTDNGATWSQPVRISQPLDVLESSLSGVKLIADGADRLHVVWQANTSEGFGQSANYARSTDGGQTWSSPFQLGYRQTGDFYIGYPSIASVGPEELDVIYVAGANKGRWERISRDGGSTWGEPQHIIPEMEGINGYVIPVVDGAGQKHLIINMRPTTTQAVGIYYSSWDGIQWSPAVRLADSGPMAETAHFAAASVRLGNEIHVVWNQVRGGEIWHMQGTIGNVKPLVVKALPTAKPTPSPEPTEALTRIIAAPQDQPLLSQSVSADINTASSSPLIPATVATVVFTAMVAIGMWWRRSQSRVK